MTFLMSRVTSCKQTQILFSWVFTRLNKAKRKKCSITTSLLVVVLERGQIDGWAIQACVVLTVFLFIYQKEKAYHDPPMRPIALDSCNLWFEHHLFDENGQRASPTATSPTGSLSLFSPLSLNPTTLLFSF